MGAPSPGQTLRTPKHAENARNFKLGDLAQPHGLRDRTTIHNRVLEWQTAWDMEDEEEAVDKNRNSERKATEDGHDTDDTIFTSPRKKNIDAALDEAIHNASAPKKRVISDEHWKKDRMSPKLENASGIANSRGVEKLTPPFGRTNPASKKYDAWVRVRPNPKKSPKVSDDDARAEPETVELLAQQRPAKQTEKLHVEQWLGTTNSQVIDEYAPKTGSGDRHSGPESPIKPRIVQYRYPDDPTKSPPDRSRQVKRKESLSSLERRHDSDNSEPRKSTPRRKTTPPPEITMAQPPRGSGNRIDAWLTTTPNVYQESISRLSDYVKATPSIAGTVAEKLMSDQGAGRPKSDLRHDVEPRASKVRYSEAARPRMDISSEGTISDDEDQCTSPTSQLKRSGAKRNFSPPKRKPVILSSSRHGVAPNKCPDPAVEDNKTGNACLGKPGNDELNAISRSHLQSIPRRTSPIPISRSDNRSRLPVVSEGSQMNMVRDSPYEGALDQGSQDCRVQPALRPTSKRKLTSHADLISVLSLPRDTTSSLKSARSMRTARSKPGLATITELMQEVRSDENKYLRELRTLVDGVIPVLLNCVLSKSQSGVASQLLGRPHGNTDVTTPIIKMGIALERLKSSHERISAQSPDAFILWSQGAHRVYADYIEAWRTGFQNVVIKLAPPERINLSERETKQVQSNWNNALPRNDEEYIVDGDGDKVDVTSLLKRPLVRLRHLARTLEGIYHISGSSQAQIWSSRFRDLVNDARRKQDEERARLEDEAASAIDATRAREPQSLAPLSGVQINPNHSVRARDFFDLKLQHSSGQRIDCHVELLIRDARSGSETTGDVLICEIDSTSRWLLFPPIQLDHISARNGDLEGEIIVMIRGTKIHGQSWHELLSLRTADEQTGFDWVRMLGVDPMPPDLETSRSTLPGIPGLSQKAMATNGGHVRVPSAVDVAMPIGEQASFISRRWEGQQPLVQGQDSDFSRIPLRQSISLPSTPVSTSERRDLSTGLFTTTSQASASRAPSSSQDRGYKVRNPQDPKDGPHDHASSLRHEDRSNQRPTYVRTSSTPSRQLPAMPKLRTTNGSSSESSVPFTIKRKEINTPDSAQPLRGRPHGGSPGSPVRPLPETPLDSPIQLRMASTPHFGQPSHEASSGGGHRRASSPLKHQYRPSSDSEDSSNSEDLSDDDDSVTSGSSTDEFMIGRLQPLSPVKYQPTSTGMRSQFAPSAPASVSPSQSASQGSYKDLRTDSIEVCKAVASIFSWSDKGMWESLFPEECSIIISPGLIEAFEMSAAHSLPLGNRPQQNLSPRPGGVDPLVALELTPLVPLRRGTAIDISIRSPPTSNSQIKSSSNIMFRSRNGQECETLYSMINRARINNPAYITMMNARGPHGDSSWAAYMDRRGIKRNPSSWWRFGSRRNSYRSKGSSRPQSVAQTESSVATMSTAISTLRRYSTSGSRIFSIGKSVVTSRDVTDRSSSGVTSSSGASTPIVDVFSDERPLGITNADIRLYQREIGSKWQDKGPARLAILHPPQTAQTTISPGRLRQEKRIVVTAKSNGHPLLDVTLGETSFERVARTGIAVSVRERLVGPNGEIGQVAQTGNVMGTRVRVYMIQMKSEAEAAYTFSLVGRLRY